MTSGNDAPSRRDMELGFMVTHNHATEQLEQLGRLAAHVYALTELLIRDAVVVPDELEERRGAIYEAMRTRDPLRWLIARVHHLTHDKYDPEYVVSIDCASRLPLCRAACCRLGFYLSNQDLEEGVVRWDLARPYHVKQGTDGYCVHCSADRRCEVWEQRPGPCRGYDCRGDARIWRDFTARIPNPAIAGRPDKIP